MFYDFSAIEASSVMSARWQQVKEAVLTEGTKRILRALGLALVMFGAIVLAGVWKVACLAVQEAIAAFQVQMQEQGLIVQEAKPLVVMDMMRVKDLQQLATQQGVQNAGRMRKRELLEALVMMR